MTLINNQEKFKAHSATDIHRVGYKWDFMVSKGDKICFLYFLCDVIIDVLVIGNSFQCLANESLFFIYILSYRFDSLLGWKVFKTFVLECVHESFNITFDPSRYKINICFVMINFVKWNWLNCILYKTNPICIFANIINTNCTHMTFHVSLSQRYFN